MNASNHRRALRAVRPDPSHCRAGERARWAALSAHARAAAAAVLRLPTTHPDVEDRAQDALVAFLASGLPRFDDARGSHEALLHVIARNCAVSHLRSRSARTRLGERLRADAPPPASDADHRRVEAACDLGRILGRLRAEHADALVRIDLHGERIGDTARRQGRSYAAVNAQVGHARSFARQVARELVAA
jgi:DNA-directed RNA polymerase specialized sigma24 family protein